MKKSKTNYFPLYFQKLHGKWEGLFWFKNTTRVIKFPNLDCDPLNIYSRHDCKSDVQKCCINMTFKSEVQK